MDLDEKAAAILRERMRMTESDLSNGEEAGEDAAVSAEMSMAMMRYMPLRAFVSFGSMTLRELEQLVERMNEA